MRQTFGMKAHGGVDSQSKLIHSVAATATNVHDSACFPDLLHGAETRVWGDSAYQGQGKVIRQHAPKAKDFTHRRYRRKGAVDVIERTRNRTKSKTRAKVEHSIGVIKRIFGFVKVPYRGLLKNANRLFATCALANLYLLRRRLLRLQGVSLHYAKSRGHTETMREYHPFQNYSRAVPQPGATFCSFFSTCSEYA